MAEMSSIDPKNGYCPQTKIFHSIRPSVPLPPEDLSLSLTQYVFSLLCSTGISLDKANVLIDTTSDTTLSYSIFLNHVENLSNFLKSHLNLSKGDTAFILSPPCFQVPILYFSLLSLGVIVSPANPISAPSEISRQIYLSQPVIAFATKETSSKIPKNLKHGTMLIDSSEFHSILNTTNTSFDKNEVVVNVNQYDIAAIMYSSGTTGMVKGVKLTHRNFIALIAGFFFNRRFPDPNDPEQEVTLFTIPLFHVFGFFMLVRAVAMAEALVLMGRFEFGEMLKAVEKYRITAIPVSPPLVVALAKSDLVEKYDLSSLRILGCGGAPLGKEVSEKFQSRFPDVKVGQGYGLTESCGGITKMVDPEEFRRYGSVGRLSELMEGMIVDPAKGEALPPGQQGELWLRGPMIMQGYVGDAKATAETLHPEGWLKTGDLCYFDSDGFLYIVDRLKELIKYKAYQVPPAELEHLLQSNPEIADAAVIGYPAEESGQIPMAYVVRKTGSSISEAQVMDFIAKQVAPYKKIRRVAFVSSIPKSPAGKILRRELVNHATSAASSKL